MEKFLFNQHIFDEPEENEPEIIEEPPAPTFSEEELEEARRSTYEQAYQKGREEALAESKASRGEMIARVLQKISNDTGLLFAAEHERDALFESEVIRVALSIFEKLYPVFMETQGSEQLRRVIADILKTQEEQSEIIVETCPDSAEGVEAFLSKMTLSGNAQTRISVIANPDLSQESCQLRWKDGGAVRDGSKLAEQIRAIMVDMLGGNTANTPDPDKNPYEPEKAHEISPNDAILEASEPDSTVPELNENIPEETSDEDLEKPNE